MNEEPITAGQYYLSVIGTAQQLLDEKKNVAEAEFEKLSFKGCRPLVIAQLQRYGIYADTTCMEITKNYWGKRSFSVELKQFATNEDSLKFNIELDEIKVLPAPDESEKRRTEARASAFRNTRKQSVDQFIKFVRLKVGGAKRTVGEFDVLWSQWIDYLVATSK